MKYIVTSLILSSWLVASSLQWSNNYHMARQQAKKENKNVILFVASKVNPSCEYMEIDMFNNEEVSKYINKDYIPVKLYIEDDVFPKGLIFYSAPSIYFLTPKGKYFDKKYHRIIGEITTTQMIKILKTIK